MAAATVTCCTSALRILPFRILCHINEYGFHRVKGNSEKAITLACDVKLHRRKLLNFRYW